MHSNDISLCDMDSVQYVQPLKMATIVKTPPLDMMNTTLPPSKVINNLVDPSAKWVFLDYLWQFLGPFLSIRHPKVKEKALNTPKKIGNGLYASLEILIKVLSPHPHPPH